MCMLCYNFGRIFIFLRVLKNNIILTSKLFFINWPVDVANVTYTTWKPKFSAFQWWVPNFAEICGTLKNLRFNAANFALYVVLFRNSWIVGVFLLWLNFSPRSSKCTSTNYIPCGRATHKLSHDVWVIARFFFEPPEICNSLGPILEKVAIFLLNKKSKSGKTPVNSLNISKYGKNWADTITL